MPLHERAQLDLPESVALHVQVLRLQPGAPLTLFDGRGGEWTAQVLEMGRRAVTVRIGEHVDVSRDGGGGDAGHRHAGQRTHDALVEKACEPAQRRSSR
jgi:16S rRNA (uracil1498-N3)-methyltransferase